MRYLLILLSSIALANPPQYYSTTASAPAFWQAVSGTGDGDGVPIAWSAGTSFEYANGFPDNTCIGSGEVIYRVSSGFSAIFSGATFNPSGGVLTPVFWTDLGVIPTWDIGTQYHAGNPVQNPEDQNYIAIGDVIADPPNVNASGMWEVLPVISTDDYTVGDKGWATLGGNVHLFQCAIDNGPSSDWGYQDPTGPVAFWEVYTGGRVWTAIITFALNDYALKPDHSAWVKSLSNGNLNHAIP